MINEIKERILKIQNGEVPEGYKKTKIGIVPIEWELKKISEICSYIYGGGTPDKKNKKYWQGSIPWISSSDIMEDNIYNINISRNITNDAINNSATKIIPKNSIIIVSRVGVGKVVINDVDLCTSQDFTNLININGDIFFITNMIQKSIKNKISLLQGSSIKGLSSKEIKKIILSLPSINEQKKIAYILTTQDKVIELKERLIEEKQKQKKYLMQNLLTGKKRLKGFNEEWKKIELKQILQETKVKNTKENLLICSVAVQKGIVNQVEHLGRSYAASDTSNYNVVSYGDIVYTKSPTGNFPYGIIKQSQLKEDVAVSPLYGVFKPLNYAIGYILHFYFQYSINTNNYLIPIIQKGAKNTINISNNTFLSNKLYLPMDKKEQTAIANILSIADKEIELLQKELEQEKQKKKSLMQLLLTGIVRVKL